MKIYRAAFYGSLRQTIYDPEAPPLDGLGRYLGPCTLRGRLVDHGQYPGFFADAEGGEVLADLIDILDPTGFFTIFDAWEDYIPGAPERSNYLRRILPLVSPEGAAWVYVSNQSPDDPEVAGGDWARHLGAT